MFTRVIEMKAKSGRSSDLADILEKKILPSLARKAGFLGQTVLASETDPDSILTFSFWRTREDAEHYERSHNARMNEILSALLSGDPLVRSFTVYTSTLHRVSFGKSA